MADRAFSGGWNSKKLNVAFGCDGCGLRCSAAWEATRQIKAGCDFYKPLVRVGKHGPEWTGKYLYLEKRLQQPFKYKRPEIVWPTSRTDIFCGGFSITQIGKIYAVAKKTPQHIYQMLTKKIKRMYQLYTDGSLKAVIEDLVSAKVEFPVENVWDGISVENNKAMRERMGLFLDMPSSLKFVSFQPLLEELEEREVSHWLSKGKIKMAIVGSEAGPLAAPVNTNSIVHLRRQLQEAGVATLTMCYPL